MTVDEFDREPESTQRVRAIPRTALMYSAGCNSRTGRRFLLICTLTISYMCSQRTVNAFFVTTCTQRLLQNDASGHLLGLTRPQAWGTAILPTRFVNPTFRVPPLGHSRMTATKSGGTTAAGAPDEVSKEMFTGEVCFDGGCIVGKDASILDELERELLELSETEKRLRREGAMMVIEKLRSEEGGRLGSLEGRLGSLGGGIAAAPTAVAPLGAGARPGVPAFPREAGESVISSRLGGKTGPTVWSEFGALAASMKDKAINLGQGFPNWSPPPFVLEASLAAMTQVRL